MSDCCDRIGCPTKEYSDPDIKNLVKKYSSGSFLGDGICQPFCGIDYCNKDTQPALSSTYGLDPTVAKNDCQPDTVASCADSPLGCYYTVVSDKYC